MRAIQLVVQEAREGAIPGRIEVPIARVVQVLVRVRPRAFAQRRARVERRDRELIRDREERVDGSIGRPTVGRDRRRPLPEPQAVGDRQGVQRVAERRARSLADRGLAWNRRHEELRVQRVALPLQREQRAARARDRVLHELGRIVEVRRVLHLEPAHAVGTPRLVRFAEPRQEIADGGALERRLRAGILHHDRLAHAARVPARLREAVVGELAVPVEIVLVRHDHDDVGLELGTMLLEPGHLLVRRIALGARVDHVDTAALALPPALEQVDEEVVALDRVAQHERITEYEHALCVHGLRRALHRIVAQSELVDVEVRRELARLAHDVRARDLAPARVRVETVQRRLRSFSHQAQAALEHQRREQRAHGEAQEHIDSAHLS